MVKQTPIAGRVYNCGSCKFSSRQQKVFYDTIQDKSKIKAMLLFQNPGGEIDSKARLDELRNKSPQEVAKIHRDGFGEWPGKYYLYFREICLHLHRKGFISKFPSRIGRDIMDEIYVSDAVKCRAKVKEEIGEWRDFSGFNSIGICSFNFLEEEINNLPNLEIIISCGNWANEALSALVKCESSKGYVKHSNYALGKIEKESFNLTPYKKDLINNYSHGKIYELDYIWPNGNKRTIKNIFLYHPSWFYNEGPLSNKPGIREKLIIKSMKWCFSRI
ncbi:hypothetical protein [Bacillus sp. X1(2014)]|uniref:hypothetical protein n=1 Tax=Bacillus sp. X1(2014) TaxID=1565991 RepID=UPI0011A3AC47|nr:hypothetical protein [Bacillus sp. X1(2014)]